MSLKGHRALLRSLRDPARVSGALLELDIAARALSAAFDVELEPRGSGCKRADLALTSDRGSRLVCEVTAISRFPQSFERAQRIQDRAYLFPSLSSSPELEVGGLFRRDIDDLEVEALEQGAEAFWRKVQEGHAPLSEEIGDALVLWAAPRNSHAAAHMRARFGEGFRGWPMQTDPLSRVLRRIPREAAQLPGDIAGVVIIDPPAFIDNPPPSHTAALIRAALDSLPHVAGGILVRREALAGPSQPVDLTEIEPGTFARARREGLMHMRELLLVLNPVRMEGSSAELLLTLFNGL